VQVLVLILILGIVAYLALFSLANPEALDLNLSLWGQASQRVHMWQVLAGGVVAGMLVVLLAAASRRGGSRKRLGAMQQELRQALGAAEDYRKRLADAEAEKERLAQRLKDAQAGGAASAETGPPSDEGGHISGESR
jgi:hypothetical protein